MDSQRILRFPPDPEHKDLPNPFAKLPSYRHSQLTFKSFSEEEIKNQAGRDSLPSIDSKREEDQVESPEADLSSSVRSRAESLKF